MEDHQPRKLAVILHADVVGSTALVQKNESLAHALIQDAFRCFSSTIEAYNGITHEIRGDALVAEFARASDAAMAGLAFQIENSESNDRLEEGMLPQLRIGISLGEVVIADSTVTGAGVVLAQRVEQLAEPGGVCITGAIYEAVPQHLPLDYFDLGRREVKGFEEPVQIYRASVKAGKQIAPESREAQSRRQNHPWIVGAVALIVLIVGGLTWWQPWVPREESASIERIAFLLPDKPSIAVLPFTNMSSDDEQEYFVDGMTEDLITDLSKLKELFVIARNSTFTYKGKSVSVRQVAEELGVRYVLEGSVRRADNQIRINAQLIDATSGGHLWAERYDGSLQDIFALQDQVTRQIVKALGVSLTGGEEAQQARHTTDNTQAHDAFLQGWAHYKLGTPGALARSIPHFKEAVRLDPDYALAHAALASVYWDAYVNDWAFDLDMPSFRAENWANEHLEKALESPTPLAHALQSRMYLSVGFTDEAVQEAESAVALDGNDATAHSALANALVLSGRPAEGTDAIGKAMRLDPHYPPDYLTILGAAQFGLKQYEEAAVTFERAVKRNSDYEIPLIYLAASYGHLGRMQEAEKTIEMANDLRATLGLGALSLEKSVNDSYSPFTGEIDFKRFGDRSSQEHVRKGLSDIPALTWQYLITVHLVLGAGNSWYEVEGATEIDLATAKSFHDKGVVFIDANSDGMWNKGHVPGAVNLPASFVTNDPAERKFKEVNISEVLDKTEDVVVYTWMPGFTGIPVWPTAKAVNWGYKKVYYFVGGVRTWKEAGYPIEKGKGGK